MTLKKIDVSTDITAKLAKELPEYVIQEKNMGKGSSLSYVSGATVTDILNSVFGPLNWDSYVVEQFIQESIPFFQKVTKWYNPPQELITINDKGEKGVWLQQAPVAWVKVRLILRTVDEHGNVNQTIKESFGSKSVIGKQSEQEHIFKSAQTDALKKAASYLGIGLQLYRNEETQFYFEAINKPVVWTEDLRNESPLWSNLLKVIDDKGIDFADVNQLVEEATESQYIDIFTLPESYMEGFIEYINDLEMDEEE